MSENSQYSTYIYEFLNINGRKKFVQEVKNGIAIVLNKNKVEAIPLRKLKQPERNAIINAAL